MKSTRGSGVGAESSEEHNALLSRAHTKIATALLDLEKYTTQAQTLSLPPSLPVSLPLSLARAVSLSCFADSHMSTAARFLGAATESIH